MKLLQSTLSYLAMLGISSHQSLANVKHVVAELNNIIHLCSACISLFHVAKTFREFTYTTFFVATTAMIAACFTIFATKRHHVFKMIDIAEELIEKSE